jgi:hypothetical protein
MNYDLAAAKLFYYLDLSPPFAIEAPAPAPVPPLFPAKFMNIYILT